MLDVCREASHKKNRIVDVVGEAPFRQDPTRFFYKMVVLDVVNHHFVERLPTKKNSRIVDVVSEAPFRQDSTRFFYKMVGLCISRLNTFHIYIYI